LFFLVIPYSLIKGEVKLNYIFSVIVVAMVVGDTQTGGLIDKRYTNQDACSRTKRKVSLQEEKILPQNESNLLNTQSLEQV
jgi:hypothetical protein